MSEIYHCGDHLNIQHRHNQCGSDPDFSDRKDPDLIYLRDIIRYLSLHSNDAW
jgi:hypothetical protein